MPKQSPKAPPKAERIKNTFSGIRRSPRLAQNLSIPQSTKTEKDIKKDAVKAASGKYFNNIPSVSGLCEKSRKRRIKRYLLS